MYQAPHLATFEKNVFQVHVLDLADPLDKMGAAL